MPSSPVSAALARIRAAADQALAGFPVTEWTPADGGEPRTIRLHGHGGFDGLEFKPAADIAIGCDLDLPDAVLGVPLTGDALEATLFSLYPATILHDGRVAFDEGGVPVASGPALFTLISSLKQGANGRLEVRIKVPNNQTTPWFQFRLTTPGLRARFEALDIAWSQLALADALVRSDADTAAVEAAAACVPDPVPQEGSALTASLARLAGALGAFADRAAAIPVHLVGHSHIDMNWLWTWADTEQVIKRDFRSVLALMDEFPELTFSHSQPATYEVIREQEPAMFARVLDHIRSGRWEPLTTCWIEGDVNMASGEAMARQVLEGVAYSRDVLGKTPTVFHAPDTFGHAGNLPQIASLGGASVYYHHRANGGQEDQWPAYWWEGQDGTRLLGTSTGSYNGDINARDIAHAAIRALRFGLPVGLHFHGIGDHGGGPSRQNLQALRRFQATPLMPGAFCSTVGAYTQEIRKASAALPVWTGESSTIFEGCYTTHADTKLYNRHGENRLAAADTLAAIAGLDAQADLQPAWRKVLFNQFHDILDGSAIHESYEKNKADFEEAVAAADAVSASASAALTTKADASSIAVTNPVGCDRVDWVVVKHDRRPGTGDGGVLLRSESGHETIGQYTEEGLGFAARVPAFGTASYRIVDGVSMSAPRMSVVPAFAPTDAREVNLLSEIASDAPYLRVDTPTFRAYVRRDCGVVVSLVDKRVGRQLVGFGMRRGSDYVDSARPELALNVFQVLDEHPHGMTAWQLNEVHTEHSLVRGATTRIVETGPARIVLEVEHKVRASTIVERIAFYADIPRIDFDADIDWQEVGTPETGVPGLKVAFTAHLPECEAWYETPFAAVKRPADGLEVPALRWADVGGETYGMALLNDCKYGYDALGCRLRLTLLRSAYDPDAISDKGRHRVRFSLVPHPGDWRDAGVVDDAAGFNQPLIGAAGAAPARAGAAFRPMVSGASTVKIACLKKAHGGAGRVVRLYESGGRGGTVEVSNLPRDAAVWETDLVERKIGKLENVGGVVSLAFRAWQVKTLLVEG